MFQDGQTLGDFEILGRLGQGGMGAVYKAQQISLERLVALKTLQGAIASDPEYIARFRREAKAAAGLNHPNLVQVYAAGENDGLHWFAMEYVEGESAQDRMKRKQRLDPAEAIAIGIHIATALEYAWRKAHLIHRDIKPDNIFLSSDGEVKLGDLGLAKQADENQSLTMTGASMGTPHYVSPEQAEGRKDVDFRADIYSLGCTLFHLVSGEPPYRGDTAMAVMLKHVTAPVPVLQTVWPASPGELSRVVMKMMLKAPAERQQTYGEVIADLRGAYDALTGALTGATVPSGFAVTKQPVQAKPAARTADIHSAPTILISPGATSAGGSPRTKAKAPLWIGLAVLGAVLAVALFLAFGKKEPQLTEAERAAKVLRGAAAPGNPIAASPTPATEPKDAPFENSLHMKFVPVPITGGPTNGQRVLFSIWDTRVQDYQIFAKETKRDWSKPLFEQGPTHPAVNVSWEDAQAFCQWLTDRERRAGMLGARERYRLPSDHEWSCAAGIGDREDAALLPEVKNRRIADVFPWGSQWPPPDKAANIASEELRTTLEDGKIVVDDAVVHGVIQNYHDGYAFTSPVESFAPNSLGLYDMGGNVQQWCEDWNDKKQTRRAMRGASFATQERPFLLSSNRPFGAATNRYHWRGFRVVLAPVASTAARPPAQAPAVHR
jgi:hypothetical protein